MSTSNARRNIYTRGERYGDITLGPPSHTLIGDDPSEVDYNLDESKLDDQKNASLFFNQRPPKLLQNQISWVPLVAETQFVTSHAQDTEFNLAVALADFPRYQDFTYTFKQYAIYSSSVTFTLPKKAKPIHVGYAFESASLNVLNNSFLFRRLPGYSSYNLKDTLTISFQPQNISRSPDELVRCWHSTNSPSVLHYGLRTEFPYTPGGPLEIKVIIHALVAFRFFGVPVL